MKAGLHRDLFLPSLLWSLFGNSNFRARDCASFIFPSRGETLVLVLHRSIRLANWFPTSRCYFAAFQGEFCLFFFPFFSLAVNVFGEQEIWKKGTFFSVCWAIPWDGRRRGYI